MTLPNRIKENRKRFTSRLEAKDPFEDQRDNLHMEPRDMLYVLNEYFSFVFTRVMEMEAEEVRDMYTDIIRAC